MLRRWLLPLLALLGVLLSVSTLTSCRLPSDYIYNSGTLGVYVDDAGVAWLVMEGCDDWPTVDRIDFYTESSDNYEQDRFAEYAVDQELGSDRWRVPLFDLDSAGYGLESGTHPTEDLLPFRVAVRPWATLVVEELPAPGSTLHVDPDRTNGTLVTPGEWIPVPNCQR